MTSPWKPAGAPSSQFSMADYVGELLLVCLGGVHERFELNGNNVPAARVNAVVLSGPQAGRIWTDALMFAVITLDQLRAEQPGSVLLGRIRAKRGGNNRDMYYIDSDITPYDDQIAQGWNAAYPGQLQQLQQQAVLLFQAEETKLGGAPHSQAAPPPPPPPPAAPPGFQPAQTVQEASAAAPPPWAPTPAPAVAQTPPAAPSWPAPPATPGAHITGGPPAPGDTSTPGY